MGKRKINAKQVYYDNIMFDSIREKNFYIYLQQNKETLGIDRIVVHPIFLLIPAYTVDCLRCDGTGKKKSPKTGRDIKCTSCKGTGQSQREEMTYTADFMTYDRIGKPKVYDVKGWKNERFPVKKKIFEKEYGMRLIEVYREQREWIYK